MNKTLILFTDTIHQNETYIVYPGSDPVDASFILKDLYNAIAKNSFEDRERIPNLVLDTFMNGPQVEERARREKYKHIDRNNCKETLFTIDLVFQAIFNYDTEEWSLVITSSKERNQRLNINNE